MGNEKILKNCRRCKHFYVTWDAQMPNGCRLYGIKSKLVPQIIVKESSGSECLGFEEKKLKENVPHDPYGD